MSDQDPYDVNRFVTAQGGVYEQACDELRNGRKSSHWIWYIFPQMKSLGFSATSQRYGIGSLAEAKAYLTHPVLGPRLNATTTLMLEHSERPLRDILGSPDDMKFCSSMTLFAEAAGADSLFAQALDTFCDGVRDERTLELLQDA